MNGVKFIYVYYNNIIIGTTSNELRAPTVWLLWGGKERKGKGREGRGEGWEVYIEELTWWGRKICGGGGRWGLGFFLEGGLVGRGLLVRGGCI